MRGSTRCWWASAKGGTTWPPARSTTVSTRAGRRVRKVPSTTYMVRAAKRVPSNQRPPRYSTVWDEGDWARSTALAPKTSSANSAQCQKRGRVERNEPFMSTSFVEEVTQVTNTLIQRWQAQSRGTPGLGEVRGGRSCQPPADRSDLNAPRALKTDRWS